MAKKRPEFSFPELDHRGRNAILRSSEEVEAEAALLQEAEGTPAIADTLAAPVPSSQKTGRETSAPVRARTHTPKPVTNNSARPAVIDQLRQKLRAKQHLTSYTFRFRAEELEQLDQLVAELNQTRASKLSKNDLVRLALAWLLTDHEEYGAASLVREVTRQE